MKKLLISANNNIRLVGNSTYPYCHIVRNKYTDKVIILTHTLIQRDTELITSSIINSHKIGDGIK